MSDSTRRHWLITITQATAGASFAVSLNAEIAPSATLPPGVYESSTSHLGHALMNADQYHPIPPGCPTDYLRPPSGPFHPRFFSEAEFPLIRRFVQLLMGEPSDASEIIQEIAGWIDFRVYSAPGVRSAAARLHPLYRTLAVAERGIDRVVTLETDDPAITCRAGLDWLHTHNFTSVSQDAQTGLLQSIGDERIDPQLQNAGTRLFSFLKTETIKAFYTSRAGLKELDFKGNAYYARSPGCSA